MRSADPAVALSLEQQRAAEAGHKAMMPIAGRPFLDFVLSAAADAGLRQIAIVVAPDAGDVRNYYGSVAPPVRVSVDFVVQERPRGTADAVLAAEAWSAAEPFLVINGDNLYPVTALSALRALDEPGLAGFDPEDLVRQGNITADRVRAFAVVEDDTGGYLTRIVEKPTAQDLERLGPGVRVSMNCWRFDTRIFEACRAVAPSPRGELELPAAVALARGSGVGFKVVPVSGGVLDLSQRADAPDVARRLNGIQPRP